MRLSLQQQLKASPSNVMPHLLLRLVWSLLLLGVQFQSLFKVMLSSTVADREWVCCAFSADLQSTVTVHALISSHPRLVHTTGSVCSMAA